MYLIWTRLFLGVAILATLAWLIVTIREPEPVKEKWHWLREQALLLAIRWQNGLLMPLPRWQPHPYTGRHRAHVA